MTGRIWMLTPSYRPVGGVVKIFDYVNHALSLDHEVVVACPKGMDPDSPLWRMDAFSGLRHDPRVRFLDDVRIAPLHQDLLFFSWPTHVTDIVARLPDGFSLDRVIHIVQNTRHANPSFAGGWGVRALSRPMTRVVINEQVREAIEPFLNPDGITQVIPLGHGADYFAIDRPAGLPRPVTVGYMTWKSDVGDRVARLLAEDERFEFCAIRDAADWVELRELYAAADIFLSAPGPQEGFYLPGLEAMAAQCLVVTPDVGGNLAYCYFDENCVEVPFEDEAAYVARLEEFLEWPDERIARFRAAGRERVAAHSLDRERTLFAELLERIDGAAGPRIVAPVPTLARRRADPAFRVLTGVPRSGTTLATHLLNRLRDVVALGEPLRPASLMGALSPHRLLDEIEAFFEGQRRSAIEDCVVESKNIEGADVDNYVRPSTEGGLRTDEAARGQMRLHRPVTEEMRLIIKDLSMSTAILGDLQGRFTVTAIVRNPVAVLLSWETVDMPFRDGHAPHAEWFCEDLARRLMVEDRRERQLRLLEWWFEQYERHLPPEHVVRYEDIIASGGRALAVVVPEAGDLDEDLQARNDNPAYQSVDRDELVDLVASRDDAVWWRYYTREDIEAMRGADTAAT